MVIELLSVLGLYTLGMILYIVIDGFISGYSFKEIKKITKYIVLTGYVVIIIYFIFFHDKNNLIPIEMIYKVK